MESARAEYEEAADLAASHPKDPALRLRQAEMARTLVDALIDEHKAGDACDVYEEISDLAVAHPREAELAAQQSSIALALIDACGKTDIAPDLKGAIKLAQVLLDDLAEIVKRFPDEAARRDEWAAAASRLASYHRELKEPSPAEKLYKNIARLAVTYPTEESLLRPLGFAGMQACIAYAEAGNTARARALHGEIARLAKAYTKTTALGDYLRMTEEALTPHHPTKR